MSAPNSGTRPRGLSIIAVLLTMMAVSGLLNAFIWPHLSASLPDEMPAQMRVGVGMLASPVVSAVEILYAISALCAAVGIWRTRPWAPPAVLAWGGCAVIMICIFAVVAPKMADMAVNWLVVVCAQLAAATVAIAVVGATWWYVRRNVSHVDL